MKMSFMLTKSVKHVFYVKNQSVQSAKPHHVVFESKRSINVMENIADEDEYNQTDEQSPRSTDVKLENEEADEEALYLQSDLQKGLVVRV